MPIVVLPEDTPESSFVYHWEERVDMKKVLLYKTIQGWHFWNLKASLSFQEINVVYRYFREVIGLDKRIL